MIGAILIVIGVITGVVGWFLLQRSGAGLRVGRLLAAAPRRTLEEVVAIADRGEEAYVQVHGRIDSDEEFPSEDGKPLVYRRRRVQQHDGSAWRTFDDERLAVPFRLVEQGRRVAIDVDALGDGLVVVPRESEGVLADVSEDAVSGPLPDLPPDTPVRLRVEQVSSVDHATASGVPRLRADGTVVLGPGLGRPLLLTTLDKEEAMRVLGSDRRSRLLVAAGLLAATPIFIVLGLLAVVFGL